jgi:hypothetical protein
MLSAGHLSIQFHLRMNRTEWAVSFTLLKIVFPPIRPERQLRAELKIYISIIKVQSSTNRIVFND